MFEEKEARLVEVDIGMCGELLKATEKNRLWLGIERVQKEGEKWLVIEGQGI